jgi:hypothetical protein
MAGFGTERRKASAGGTIQGHARSLKLDSYRVEKKASMKVALG